MDEERAQSRLRLFFRRGLGSLLPTLLTIIVIVACYNFLDDKISTPINGWIHQAVASTDSGKRYLLEHWRIDVDAKRYQLEEEFGTDRWHTLADADGALDGERLYRLLARWDRIPPIIGFSLGLAFVFLLGFVVATYAGRRLFSSFERFLSNIPVVKVIFPYAKQLVDFVFREKKAPEFSSVVAVPFPSRDIYQIAFLTGGGLSKLDEATGRRYLNVFVPSSPTPFTGWAVFIPEDEIVPLPFSVDEAIRFVVSGGVIAPEGHGLATPDPRAALGRASEIGRTRA